MPNDNLDITELSEWTPEEVKNYIENNVHNVVSVNDKSLTITTFLGQEKLHTTRYSIKECQRVLRKAAKRELFKPQEWELYENDRYVTTYPSHTEAKKALHQYRRDAKLDYLDVDYEIKPKKALHQDKRDAKLDWLDVN